MVKLGFKRLYLDVGIFVHFDKAGHIEVIAVIYVDNSIFLGPNKSIVLAAKGAFMNMWECHDLGETKEFLHMRIHHLSTSIMLDQTDYLKKVQQQFGMEHANSAPTPLPQGYIPTPNTDPVNEVI